MECFVGLQGQRFLVQLCLVELGSVFQNPHRMKAYVGDHVFVPRCFSPELKFVRHVGVYSKRVDCLPIGVYGEPTKGYRHLVMVMVCSLTIPFLVKEIIRFEVESATEFLTACSHILQLKRCGRQRYPYRWFCSLKSKNCCHELS